MKLAAANYTAIVGIDDQIRFIRGDDTFDDERLIDPDCRDGKCRSCVGGPCEHECHDRP